MASSKTLQAIVEIAGSLSPTLGKAAEEASKSLEGINLKAVAVGAGVAAAGAAIGKATIEAGKYLVDLGGQFDNVVDTIRIGTGATGDALDALTDDFNEVYKSVPTTMEDASQAIADYNTLIGGFRDEEELCDYPIIGDSAGRRLAEYALFPERRRPLHDPVELNTADSAALRSVSGIGAKTVGAILDYRRRLGGFCRAEQLAEVRGVTESNYERILKQISVDSCRISKIDINFATPKALAEHPYIAPRTLRKILKRRQLKGGWSTLEEMIEDGILTREEADRLHPYLRFGVRTTQNDE